MTDDETRERNLASVRRAFAGIGAADAAGQLANYTNDMVLELPYADPPKRIEGKDVALPYLANALAAFAIELTITVVHEAADPDELIVESSGTGTYNAQRRGLRQPYIAVFGFRDGLICRQREFYNPLAAQRAATGG